jgi:hypothetical protein
MAGSKDYVRLVPKSQTHSEGCVKTLENMLEIARKGEIVGVAIAATDREGYTHTSYEPGENMATLLGALERLRHRLLTHWE